MAIQHYSIIESYQFYYLLNLKKYFNLSEIETIFT